jgi:hypothetical protein
MPVLISKARRTLAGRLRAIRPGVIFRRGRHLLFEYGAERDADLHELAWA